MSKGYFQGYGFGINRDEISDEMDLILCRAGIISYPDLSRFGNVEM